MTAREVRLGEIAVIRQGISSSRRAAGARAGNWPLRVVSVGDIQDDRLVVDATRYIHVEQNVKTEKHLLQPDDVLVTARSTVVKAALAPPMATRTVADATLLVVHPDEALFGLGLYLWWWLTSTVGRQALRDRMSGVTLLSLSAGNLAEMRLPLPAPRDLYRLAEMIDASERAYGAAIEAAALRRALYRDAVIDRLRAETERPGG